VGPGRRDLCGRRLLAAKGAPADCPEAIFAYDHAEWYVQAVLSQAAVYRADFAPAAPAAVGTVLNASRLPS
jgi:hypothetical protein